MVQGEIKRNNYKGALKDAGRQIGNMGMDMTPVLGDARAIREAIRNPSAFNVTTAAAGLIPGVGEARGALRGGLRATDAFDTLSDGVKLSTDDALASALDVLGDDYTEIANGVFRSADETFQVRMTDSDLRKTNNHAGAPHMNFEKLSTNSRGKTVVKKEDNKHVFLLEEK